MLWKSQIATLPGLFMAIQLKVVQQLMQKTPALIPGLETNEMIQ